MRIGLIITIYNEDKTLGILFDSIFSQSKQIDSIVVVDSKSNDGSINLLNTYVKKFDKKKIDFKIISKKSNRARGRNIAIKNSDADIIIVTDGGCILQKNWVKNLVSAFKDKNVDVAAGFYKPITKNTFEKCLSSYTCVMEDKLNNDFLPSSRSIAFKKSAWGKVGGYPENLDTCEDLVFARNLKSSGFKFKVAKNAIVFWRQKENLYQAFKQFFSYAKGDGQAFYIRWNTPFLFMRYVLGIFILAISLKEDFLRLPLLILFLSYLLWSIYKNFRYIKKVEAIIYLPLLQLVSDIAVMSGFIYGLFIRKVNP